MTEIEAAPRVTSTASPVKSLTHDGQRYRAARAVVVSAAVGKHR